ncbi:hypothetical protein BC831DRAFT_472454 [Entophlyctis helioformis]|nr:hypothetical protein BC831DRAFT_472454 [Entophlyctis helioformis]
MLAMETPVLNPGQAAPAAEPQTAEPQTADEPRRRLVQETLSKAQPSVVPALASTADTSPVSAVVPFTIDTKYYTAQVAFDLQADVEGSLTEIDGAAVRDTNGARCDALLFILDDDMVCDLKNGRIHTDDGEDGEGQEHLGSKRLSQTLAWIESFVSDYDTSIAMAIAVLEDQDESEQDDGQYRQLEMACLDAGVELVLWRPTSAKNATPEAAESASTQARTFGSLLTDDGDIAQELVGVDRILEAFTNHVWETLQRKTGPSQAARPAHDFGGYSLGDVEDMGKALFGALDGDDGAGDSDGDRGIEGESDAFENTLRMLQHMRAQGQTMSDEERRIMAEKVALAFHLQLVGDDEDDDDDEVEA